MERGSQMGHRSVPPKLTLPAPRQHLSFSSFSRHYPAPTPTAAGKSSFLFSPSVTPTPSKRIRASEGPFWIITLLELLSLYALHKWLTSFDTTPPLALFTFFALLGSAVALIAIHHSWKGRKVLSYQWGLLVGSGGVWALSLMLRFQGLRSCGPLETILAEFAGALGGKVFFEFWRKNSDKARKARGLMALAIAVFLLSHGWARASCSPLAFDVGYRNRGVRAKINDEPKDCVRLFWIFAPILAGVLSAFQKSMATRSSLKGLGKNRVHTLTHAVAALILFPFAVLQIALMAGQSHWQISGSVLWPWFSTVAFGMVLASYGDAYEEKKLLLPAYSFKAFLIVSCCVCVLELLYGLDISLLGFLFCTSLLGIGVQELSSVPGNILEGLGDGDSTSLVYSSWVKSPLWHIVSDKKSRKIAMFLLINTGFMAVEFFFGFLSNSLGLISDACHMLFDCAALAIGLYASYISRLRANSRFNYGYGRFEIVSGYANAVLLVLVASLIVLESIERILEPPEISTESLLVVSVGGLLVNIVGLIFFHDEHHHAHGSGGPHSHDHHEADTSSHKSFTSSTVDSKRDDSVEHSIVDCGTASLHLHANTSQIDQANQFSSMNHEKGCDHGSLDRQLEKVYSSHADHISSSHWKAEAPSCNHLNHEHNHMESELSYSLIEGREAGHSIGGSSTSRKEFDVNNKSHSHEHQCTSGTHTHFHGSHEHGNDDFHGPGSAGFSNSSKHNVHHLLTEDTDHDHSFKEQEKHLGHHNEHSVNLPEQSHFRSKGQASENSYHDHHHSNNMDIKADQCPNHHHHHHEDGDHHQQHGDHHHQHSNNDQHDDHHSNYLKSMPDQHHLHGHDHHLHHGIDHQHGAHHHHQDGNHHHHHSSDHHQHMDHNMQGIFLHVLADTLGSVGVVISTLLIKYKGWLITDPACSIFISVLIISSVVPLLRNSAEVLLQRMPRFNESGLKQAVNDIANKPGVRNYQRVHIWSFTNKEVVGSVHLQVSAGSDKTMIRRSVSQLLHNAGIVDLTVQLEDT